MTRGEDHHTDIFSVLPWCPRRAPSNQSVANPSCPFSWHCFGHPFLILFKSARCSKRLVASSVPGTAEREANFQRLKRERGSFFAFHGSKSDNWHAILHLGLRNMSGEHPYSRGHYVSLPVPPSLDRFASRPCLVPGHWSWGTSQGRFGFRLPPMTLAGF